MAAEVDVDAAAAVSAIVGMELELVVKPGVRPEVSVMALKLESINFKLLQMLRQGNVAQMSRP